MRAARYYGQEDVRVEDVDPDPVGPNDVRIDVAACGICGSDLHEYHTGPGAVPTEPHPVTGASLPLTIGHELGGTVSETGDDVDLPVGTTVAVNPIVWCGECTYCLRGAYHLCENGGFVGLSRNGGFAENVVVSAEKVVPVPDGVPADLAALVEPFSVGLHAVHQAELAVGDSVAVFGAGPIGNTIIQAALAANAGPVYVSEPRDARREFAARVGADHVIDPREADPVERVRDDLGGVDVAFEVAGIEVTLNQAIEATRAGGRTTVVSLFEETAAIHPSALVTRERTMNGTAAFHGGPRALEEAGVTARNFADGALDPGAIVTSRIDLEDIVEEGFERLSDPESDEMKILVRP